MIDSLEALARQVDAEHRDMVLWFQLREESGCNERRCSAWAERPRTRAEIIVHHGEASRNFEQGPATYKQVATWLRESHK